jgi:membrane protease YdiL (CAAX protease family)
MQGLGLTALLVAMVFAAYLGLAGSAGVVSLAKAIWSMPWDERVVYLILGSKVAFVEETLFRGDLLGRLSSKWGMVAGIVISSVLFALFHRTLAPTPLAMKFVIGVLFSVSTIKSQSLVPSAIAHWLLWVIVGNN